MKSQLLSGLLLGGLVASAASVDFNREIRPILSDTCFTCHGPDEKQRMMNLRLDTRDGAFAVIVAGDAANSKLYQRISAENKAARMPPATSGRSLSDKQIELIRRWITEGARWDTHWSYLPPKRPELPKVAGAAWPRNPIDSFVLARLERENLKPSPEADKTTLLRRVTLDLTGLPPAPAEIDAYLADKSADAYEKVVDRLLRTSRHAERMALQWLDVSRYADTHGYHIDSHRDMWPWRDWLIRAFERNLPFDQFTIEQLAGDLLPGATLEQQIATGFNRNHMINYEGGAIPEEYLNEYVVDRVETTAAAWMGTTMQCARCHDHKYDPFRQKEFYQFYAFFNTISEKGLDGRKGNADPLVQLPTPEQKPRLEALTREIAAREEAMPEAEVAKLLGEWEKRRRAELLAAPAGPPAPGLTAHYEFEGGATDSSGRYQHGRVLRSDVAFPAGPTGRAADFDGEAHVTFGNAGDFDRDAAFSAAFWWRASGKIETDLLEKVDETRRGWQISLDEFVPIGDLKRGAYLYVRLIHQWPGDLVRVRTTRRLAQSEWRHLALVYDGSGKAAGLKLYLDGKREEIETLDDRLSGSFRNAGALEIGSRRNAERFKGQLDDLRLYSRVLEPDEIERLAVHDPIPATLFAAGKRSNDQRDRLRDYFLTYDAPEPLRKLHAELKSLKAEKEELDKIVPTVMVMKEMEKPRDTYVLERGDYRNKRDKVAPGVPSVLPPLPKDAPPNRLGLARWLVDPSHPLTARVAVNRYWQMYFGLGLVKTAEDFGSQGEPPVHPELLDWLATEFVRSGWDIRAMQRLIVTSATYRQSSRATPELRERDPENRLLARASRFRLPAEAVRDNALAAGGLLVEKVGGPGVYPYQPKGVWEDIAYGDVYSAQTYASDRGPDLYRRSMYTFWKRTAPPASMATFDAPDREKCTARRPVTNTPLQALVLMNDPTYVEAARALAQRMIREGGRDASRRIALGFRLAAARRPAAQEVRLLNELARRQLDHYRRSPEAAQKLLRVGESALDAKIEASELAAWTMVASSILNLDEMITRE